MKLAEFNNLYKKIARDVLGSQIVIDGVNIHVINGESHLAIIRQGSMINMMGIAKFVIGYRHTFLQTIDQNNAKLSSNPHDYPFRFLLEDINNFSEDNVRYKPKNLSTHSEEIEVSSLNEIEAENLLREIFTHIKNIFPRLAKKLTPDFIEQEIQKYGEGAWIEKIWIEDYYSRK